MRVWSLSVSGRIEEEWMTDEAVVTLVADCLKVNSNIKDIG